MIYDVKLDGQSVFDYSYPDFVLLNPVLETEVNSAGSLEFTMPQGHVFYDKVKMLTSDVEVYEDGTLIWFGRPVELKRNFQNERQVYCEGALAFFNDSVQELHEYRSISIHEFFRTVIGKHNEQVEKNRQFQIGTITVPDRTVYRKLRYEQTYDVLKRQCLSAEGGYFFVRKEEGVNYIDWLKEMPFSCSQPIEFGLNLLDVESSAGGTEFATCVLPLGEQDETTQAPVTVESVNGGKKIIESEAAKTYGKITKAVEFEGVTHPDTLYQDGVEYLESLQFDHVKIECEASELHFLNHHYEAFRVGQMIRCISLPHLIDTTLPLTKITLHLDSAVKQVTLGTTEEQTLTEIYADGGMHTSNGADLEEVSDDLDDLRDEYEGTKDSFEQIQSEYRDDWDSIGKMQEDLAGLKDDFENYKDSSGTSSGENPGGISGESEVSEELTELREELNDLKYQVENMDYGGSDWAHWTGTQEEYDALKQKGEETVYFIIDEEES